MKGPGKRLANEWRRLRVALIVLALGGTVWTVVLRFTTGLKAQLCDRLPATVGLVLAAAALVLPLASLCGDGRLARLAARRGGRLPRWPILAPKFLVCLGAWVVLAAWASAVGFACSPSAECFAEWLRMLEAGWLWVLIAIGGAFFASAAASQLPTAIVLALFLAILPPFLMRYPFDLPLSSGGGHATRAIVGGLATLWLLGAAALAFPMRFAALTNWRAKALAGLKTGACVASAVLSAVSLAPLLIVVSCLLLGPEDIVKLTELKLSPDRQHLTLTAYFEGWPFDTPMRSCYVLNAKTGQAWRLSRFQRSTGRRTCLWGGEGWSPQGRCFAYSITPGPLRAVWLGLCGVDPGCDDSVGVFDTQAGEAREVRHRVIRYGSCVYWKDECYLDVWPGTGRAGEKPGMTTEEGFFRYRVGDRVEPLPAGELATVRLEPGKWEGISHPSKVGWWLVRDHETADFALAFWQANAPGSQGGKFELKDHQRGTTRELGEVNVPFSKVRDRSAFSPEGRWLAYPALDGKGSPAMWLLELASGQLRKLSAPGAALEWLPRFTPDETRLVWLPGEQVARHTSGGKEKLRFYVQELPLGVPRPLELPMHGGGALCDMECAGPDNMCLYFVRGASLCRVRLDGTGLESLFPRRAPLPR